MSRETLLAQISVQLAETMVVPMRLRGSIIGALHLFDADDGALHEADSLAAESGRCRDRRHPPEPPAFAAHQVIEQFNEALDRVTIEQARGRSRRAGWRQH